MKLVFSNSYVKGSKELSVIDISQLLKLHSIIPNSSEATDRIMRDYINGLDIEIDLIGTDSSQLKKFLSEFDKRGWGYEIKE